MAEVLSGLAGLEGAVGQPECAARLFGAAEIALETIGAPLSPADRVEWERAVATIRARLDPAAFQVAWLDGRTMALEQALAYALLDWSNAASNGYVIDLSNLSSGKGGR
jgi:hypothetical protein